MTSRPYSALVLLIALAPSACSLTNDLSGYAGGRTPDSTVSDSVSAADTMVVTVDTGEPVGEDAGAVDGGSKDATVDGATDTSVPDGGTDTRVAEAATDAGFDTTTTDTKTDTGSPADTAVTDSGPADVADAGADPCLTTFASFNVSELMVRAISGTLAPSDRHEWVEITNYGSTALDVSGVTVKIFSSTGSTEKAAFTFPASTIVPAGEAVVIASNKALFLADVSGTFAIADRVFDFAKPGDLLTNSGFEVRLAGPGCVANYEVAKVSTRTWIEGATYVFPAGCLPSDRYSATGTLTSKWEDTPALPANQYGTVSNEDAGVLPLYGSPTKANSGVPCP